MAAAAVRKLGRQGHLIIGIIYESEFEFKIFYEYETTLECTGRNE